MVTPSRSARSPEAQFTQLGILGLSLTPIVVAISIALGFKPSFTKCPFQWLFGFPSPTCGLTRSLVALIQGNWQQVFVYHLFSPIVLVVCLAVALQMGIGLITGKPRILTWKKGWAVPLLILLLAYYALRLYARYTIGDLPFDFDNSPVWQLVQTGAKAL